MAEAGSPGSGADSPHSDEYGGNHGSGDRDNSNVREQDRFLPIANISRIMKKALPANAKIAKDAKETVQECVSEFISFITSEYPFRVGGGGGRALPHSWGRRPGLSCGPAAWWGAIAAQGRGWCVWGLQAGCGGGSGVVWVGFLVVGFLLRSSSGIVCGAGLLAVQAAGGWYVRVGAVRA